MDSSPVAEAECSRPNGGLTDLLEEPAGGGSIGRFRQRLDRLTDPDPPGQLAWTPVGSLRQADEIAGSGLRSEKGRSALSRDESDVENKGLIGWSDRRDL